MRLSNDSNSTEENDKIKDIILQTKSNISLLDNLINEGDEDIEKLEQTLQSYYDKKDSLEQQYNESLDNILMLQKSMENIVLQIRCIPRRQRSWRHWFTGGKKTKKQKTKYYYKLYTKNKRNGIKKNC